MVSVAIHFGAYCSINAYSVWRARYLQSTDDGIDSPVLEVGLVEVSESSVLEQVEQREPDKPEMMKAADQDSEIMIARLSPEEESNSHREPDENRELMEPDKTGPAYPEGRAGISRSAAGSSSHEYLTGVRRQIAEAIYYPRRARLSHLEGVVIVSFLIGDDGSMEGFKVVEPSSYTVFNQAAHEIMEKASPFSPPGPEIIGWEITVPIKFESTY